MKKVFRQIPGGKVKKIKNRFGSDHRYTDWGVEPRSSVIARILDDEVREALVEGDHPAAHIETALDIPELRDLVVSCGRPEDDDTDGSDLHWYIPVDVPKQNGGFSRRRKHQTKPPVREFRPAKRQLLPIDYAISRSA